MPKKKQSESGFFTTKRGRNVLENLTAYAFLAPAALLIFIFELFPVAFAFFVSLWEWEFFPDEYEGLDRYTDALGHFTFVLFFWLAVGVIVFGLYMLRRFLKQVWQAGDKRNMGYFVPGIAIAAAIMAFTNWFFALLPQILLIPRQLRSLGNNAEGFITAFFQAFRTEESVLAANDLMLVLIAGAIIITIIFVRLLRSEDAPQYLLNASVAAGAIAAGFFLMQLTVTEMQLVIADAIEDGENAPIWTYIIMISAGAGLIGLAVYLWQSVLKPATSNRRFFVQMAIIICLVLGGVLLIMFLPQSFADSDEDVLQAFSVSFMYSAFTVPIQLSIGLGLAVLLFQKIKGQQAFRVIFFLPYITPIIGTSVVFRILFSQTSSSPINSFIGLFGIEEQRWLLESKGIFELMFGSDVPQPLVGPSLALVVIIIYGIWTFAGYSTVIFLAGLGNIPTEVYEAARIDGANGWQQFRHVTVPLLSPTTFFLILITTIGTLQAFTQIFLLRTPATENSVDTVNLIIFEQVRSTSNIDYGYGAALAFVLFGVILVLTVIQNRIVGRRVFYG